ncbi:MAG TPA: glycosyltransferase family 2 protein [Nocardioides sp.]|jgi:glycosyltransferase involved in cell wall biosynthesis|nr:glycosyltransferase family 2 protein [Nocardioides sp.]
MPGQVPRADVTVVVPAFNEGARVASVVSELRTQFGRVVVVDDGSEDHTAELARAAGAHVVRHPGNLGQGAALQTGFAYALTDPGMRHVITFDSDGQHRVEDALSLLEVARESGVDVVLGSRFLTPGAAVPAARRAVLRAGIAFTRATTRLAVTDTHNGLRVLNRHAVRQIDLTLSDMAHASQLLGLIARRGLSWTEAPVVIDYADETRRRGQSNVNALNIVFDLAVERLRSAG